jgi:hypothetical protein
MPYVNKPRPYKKEYQQQKERDELPRRMERQRARRELDKEGVSRKGKDVAHVKALADGGSNKDGVFLESAKANRSYARTSSSKPKSAKDSGVKGKKVYKVK